MTLTVTDRSNVPHQTTLLISANNTPPTVAITSPTNGMRYPMSTQTTYPLSALISDTEHSSEQLNCTWITTLHHNNHIHSDPADTNCTSTVTILATGLRWPNVLLQHRVESDRPAGLSTTQEVRLYPDCPDLPPTLRFLERDSFGAIRWRLTGDPAYTYLVEGSTNLFEWVPVTSITPVAGTEFSDPDAGNLRFRFYRAVPAP